MMGVRFAFKLAGALASAMVIAATPARAADRDTTTAKARDVRAASGRLMGRGDLAYLVVSVAAVGVAMHNDRWLTDETTESHSAGETHLASWAQPLGNTAVVLPALALSYGIARWSHHSEGARATLRIGASVGVAGGVAVVLKEVVGRSRPSEKPDDAASFRPFSGHTSFPSGHATIAFAAAAAADRELSTKWFQWIAYPAAALLGWSRVHDGRHWTSDVVAGAAVGIWTGRKADDWLRSSGSRIGFVLLPGRGGARLTLGF